MKQLLYILTLLMSLPLPGFAQADSSCITSAEVKKVTGTSMEGIINQGSLVTLLYGFYTCNEVQRGDVAAYDYAGLEIPVIKRVCAIPGDSFRLSPLDAASHCIIINSDTIKDVSGAVFVIRKGQYGLLSIYEREYNNLIPADTYMLLGSRAGTTDSGRFGLVDRKDLLGKIVYTTAPGR